MRSLASSWPKSVVITGGVLNGDGSHCNEGTNLKFTPSTHFNFEHFVVRARAQFTRMFDEQMQREHLGAIIDLCFNVDQQMRVVVVLLESGRVEQIRNGELMQHDAPPSRK